MRYDRGNSPEYWDDYWSKPKSRYERYSMQRAIQEIRSSGAKSVLDVGCGNGKLLSFVKDLVCFGIDISPKAISVMKDRYGIPGLAISAYELDVLGNKYDFVVCNHTLEHLQEDYEALLKIRERLNKDGVFFCAVPNNISSPEETDLHCQMYDSQKLSDLLTDVFGNSKMEIIGRHLIGICRKQ